MSVSPVRRHPKKPCAARHRLLLLEPLERRLPLALTINWINRGDDGFDDVFEGNAEVARVVVDHAIQDWANVFDDWADYSDDVFEIEINMGLPGLPPPFILPDALYDGCGGFAVPDSQDTILVLGILVPDPSDPLFTDGTPNEGRIYLGQCNSGDDWFLDPTPWEHSEFLGPTLNAFYGEAWNGTNPITGLSETNPAANKSDLYTVVAHELGHALGILPTQDALIGPIFALLNAPFPTPPFQWDDEIGFLLQNALTADAANDGDLYTLQSGGFQALYSTANEAGSDSPVHVAAPDPANTVAGGFFGARDMNAESPDGARWLPSLLTATALSSVYGHSLFGLDHFSQFYIQMVRPDLSQPGTLVVRGGSPGEGPIYSDTGDSDDVITLSESGGNLLTEVDLGQDVKGTHTDGLVYAQSVPLADIGRVRVFGFDGWNPGPTGDGDDQVTLDFSTSLWIPAQGMTADGGTGENTLTIVGPATASNYQITDTEITIDGQIISYANFPHLVLITGGGDDAVTVNIASNNLLSLHIDSGAGNDAIDIEDISAIAQLEIATGPDDDIVQFTPTAGDLGLMALGSANPATVFGGGGDDLLVLADFAEAGDVDYTFDADFTVYLAGEGRIRRGVDHYFVHRDVEEVLLNAGGGSSEFFIRGTPVNSDLTISAAEGDDTFLVATADILFPTVDRVHSHVTVDGGPGINTALLNDLRDITPPDDQVTVTDATVGASPGDLYFGLGGSFEYYQLVALTVQVGEEDNTILVESTAEGTDTHIFAGRGSDEIVVTAPEEPGSIPVPAQERRGTADQIKSLLTIDGELGDDSLFVIDTTDDTADKMTVTENTIGRAAASVGPPNPDTFLGPASLGIEYTSIADLTIRMGKGGNSVFVRSTHPQTTTRIETGEAEDSVLLRDGAATVNLIRSSLTIDGQNGHDQVYVDDGNETIASSVTVTPSQVLGDGTYFGAGGALNYQGLELLTVESGESGDVALVTGTNPGTETVLHTGQTVDQVTVMSAALTNLVRSPLTIDGDAGGAVLLVVNAFDLAPNQVTVTDTQVLGSGTYFGPGGSLIYANLEQLALHTGQGNDIVNFQSTNPATAYLADAGPGADAFLVDSNGLTPGGSVDGIASQVVLVGGPGAGNLLILTDADDPTGDTVSVIPSAALAGDVGTGPTDDYFAPGGTVHYEDITFLFLGTSQGADVIHAAPAASLPIGTVLVIDGNTPTYSDPPPGDRLHLDLAGIADAKVTMNQLGGGSLSSSTHANVNFRNIELVDDPAGGNYDLILDTTVGTLGGNDGIDDRIEAFSGSGGGQKTLNLRLNGSLAFVGIESAIRSLTVSGSTDKDTLAVLETPEGLPTLAGSSPAGHTSAPFAASGLGPSNVSIHFDGGTGPELDSLDGIFITSPNVAKFDDLIAPTKSGVVNVSGAFTLSYGNLEPVSFQAAGGTLTINAAGLPGMTQMNVVDLGGGAVEVRGNGGFETTTASGFESLIVSPPQGVPLVVGNPRRLDGTLIKRGNELTVLGSSRSDSIDIRETEEGLFVAFGAGPEIGMAGIASLRIETSGGSDQVDASLLSVVEVTAMLGDGSDEFSAELGHVAGTGLFQKVRVLADGGAGDDVIDIAGQFSVLSSSLPTQAPPALAAELIADGGGGRDKLRISSQIAFVLQPQPLDPPPDPWRLPDTSVFVQLIGGQGSDDFDAATEEHIVSPNGQRMAGLIIPGRHVSNIQLDAGDGADDAAVQAAPFLADVSLTALLGAGHDQLEMLVPTLDPDLPIVRTAHVIRVDGGAGDDEVRFPYPVDPSGDVANRSAAPGAFDSPWIDMGPGADALFIDRDLVGEAFVDLGPGPDIADLRGALFGRLSILGGSGDDRIDARMGVEPTPFSPHEIVAICVDGGAGKDHISVAAKVKAAFDLPRSPNLPPAIQFYLDLRGGGGDDTIRAEIGADPAAQKVAQLHAALFGGDGDDELTLLLDDEIDADVLSAFIDGGSGFDRARISRRVRAIRCEKVVVD